MTSLQAYRHPNGGVGVRNHLFTLPTVVCANQVAIDVAHRYSDLKYIEHQHGCAQIGSDLEQTRRIFSRLAMHPNVYASIFVSLGCEGIVAKQLFSSTVALTNKPIDLVVIQEAGGTLGAESTVESWIEQRRNELNQCARETIGWDELVVGVLIDSHIPTNSHIAIACVEAIRAAGARVVLPNNQTELVNQLGCPVTAVGYGESTNGPIWTIMPGSNVLETTTGLTAAGAHLIVHLTNEAHAFGSPLAPTVRWCMNERNYQKFHEDFDGQLQDELDIPRLLEQITRIANGQLSVAESSGMDDFALYRIGPTV